MVLLTRGIRSLLKRTEPGRLCKSKKYTCYRAVAPNGRPSGKRLGGVAKRLSETLWSNGELPCERENRGGAWKGLGGGRRRGRAVDSQVSRLCNATAHVRSSARMLKLTRISLIALEYHGLLPVTAQRVVLDERRGVGTAIDIVCRRGEDELVIVELKTGYLGCKSVPAALNGFVCKFAAPLSTATDCVLHRHFAQLSATLALFASEGRTRSDLAQRGLTKISAAVLYVSDAGSELHPLPGWWQRRGEQLLDVIAH
jgi:hypothetical protein